MITGDLIRHRQEDNSFGVVMSVDIRPPDYTPVEIKVLWFDQDYPAIEWYPESELTVISSTEFKPLDWEDGVLTVKS